MVSIVKLALLADEGREWRSLSADERRSWQQEAAAPTPEGWARYVEDMEDARR